MRSAIFWGMDTSARLLEIAAFMRGLNPLALTQAEINLLDTISGAAFAATHEAIMNKMAEESVALDAETASYGAACQFDSVDR